MSDDEILVVVLVVIAGALLFKKPGGSTGVTSITGSGGLLPCCDADGNIVDAGNSMYCPTGTNVC